MKREELLCFLAWWFVQRVRKRKKIGELSFAVDAQFAQREQLDWGLRVERREIGRA